MNYCYSIMPYNYYNSAPVQIQLQKIKTIQNIQYGFKVLIVIRGLPGSGKTYLANHLINCSIGPAQYNKHILNADNFFLQNNCYIYDSSKLLEANIYNYKQVLSAVANGISPIIVDDTNIEIWEMKPFAMIAFNYGYILEIFESETWWRFSEHLCAQRTKYNIAIPVIRDMIHRYDQNVTAENLFNKYNIGYKFLGPTQFCNYPPLMISGQPESTFFANTLSDISGSSGSGNNSHGYFMEEVVRADESKNDHSNNTSIPFRFNLTSSSETHNLTDYNGPQTISFANYEAPTQYLSTDCFDLNSVNFVDFDVAAQISSDLNVLQITNCMDSDADPQNLGDNGEKVHIISVVDLEANNTQTSNVFRELPEATCLDYFENATQISSASDPCNRQIINSEDFYDSPGATCLGYYDTAPQTSTADSCSPQVVKTEDFYDSPGATCLGYYDTVPQTSSADSCSGQVVNSKAQNSEDFYGVPGATCLGYFDMVPQVSSTSDSCNRQTVSPVSQVCGNVYDVQGASCLGYFGNTPQTPSINSCNRQTVSPVAHNSRRDDFQNANSIDDFEIALQNSLFDFFNRQKISPSSAQNSNDFNGETVNCLNYFETVVQNSLTNYCNNQTINSSVVAQNSRDINEVRAPSCDVDYFETASENSPTRYSDRRTASPVDLNSNIEVYNHEDVLSDDDASSTKNNYDYFQTFKTDSESGTCSSSLLCYDSDPEEEEGVYVLAIEGDEEETNYKAVDDDNNRNLIAEQTEAKEMAVQVMKSEKVKTDEEIKTIDLKTKEINSKNNRKVTNNLKNNFDLSRGLEDITIQYCIDRIKDHLIKYYFLNSRSTQCFQKDEFNLSYYYRGLAIKENEYYQKYKTLLRDLLQNGNN